MVSQRDDFVEAEALLRRVLKIEETILGPEHPEVAADLAALGSLLLTTGELDEARQLTTRAVQIYLHLGKRLRRIHPHLPSALLLLSDIKRAQGESEDEIAAEERAFLGAESPKRERPVIAPRRQSRPGR
ncbi:MAG: tetratricopeptide repeat protein [Verrucomicrobiaceae bacterium]|nr:MAG: tetratricopeptide repeat protein [Verrucomicrobiaceae bacterium]